MLLQFVDRYQGEIAALSRGEDGGDGDGGRNFRQISGRN